MARILQVVDGSVLHWWTVGEADLPLLRYAFALLESDGEPFPASTLRSDRKRGPELLMVVAGHGFVLDEDDYVVDV